MKVEFKKQKWSKKYDCCVVCGSTKKKHKGRGIGLCCWDNERLKNPKRAILKKISGVRFGFRFRVLHYLENKRKKKQSFFGDKKEQRKKDFKRFWGYKKRGEIRKKEGKNVLQIIKNGEIIYLPILVENFEKPRLSTLHLKDKEEIFLKTKKYEREMKKYKKYLEIFDFCRNFKSFEEIKKEKI